MLARHPDEGDGELSALVDLDIKYLFVEPIRFTYLPLDAIAVNGVFKMAFRHADKNLGRVFFAAIKNLIDCT